MRVVGEANKYLSDQAPWKLKEDPARRDTVLHTALQAIKDCNALLTPFLPHSVAAGARAARRHRASGRSRREVARGHRPRRRLAVPDHHRRPTTRGRRSGRPRRCPRRARRWPPPTPVFTKLDPSVVDEELGPARRRRPDAACEREPVGVLPGQPPGRAAAVPGAAAGAGAGQPHAPRHRRWGSGRPTASTASGPPDERGRRRDRRRGRRRASRGWCRSGVDVAVVPLVGRAGRPAPERARRRRAAPQRGRRRRGDRRRAGRDRPAGRRCRGCARWGRPGWTATAPAPEGWAAQEASFRAHIRHRQGARASRWSSTTGTRTTRSCGVLEDEGAPEHTVLHCFSGDAAFARACVERGLRPVLRRHADLRQRRLPARGGRADPAGPAAGGDRRAVPHPGAATAAGPNASRLVPHTVRALAEVTGTDLDRAVRALTATAERVFGSWEADRAAGPSRPRCRSERGHWRRGPSHRRRRSSSPCSFPAGCWRRAWWLAAGRRAVATGGGRVRPSRRPEAHRRAAPPGRSTAAGCGASGCCSGMACVVGTVVLFAEASVFLWVPALAVGLLVGVLLAEATRPRPRWAVERAGRAVRAASSRSRCGCCGRCAPWSPGRRSRRRPCGPPGELRRRDSAALARCRWSGWLLAEVALLRVLVRPLPGEGRRRARWTRRCAPGPRTWSPRRPACSALLPLGALLLSPAIDLGDRVTQGFDLLPGGAGRRRLLRAGRRGGGGRVPAHLAAAGAADSPRAWPADVGASGRPRTALDPRPERSHTVALVTPRCSLCTASHRPHAARRSPCVAARPHGARSTCWFTARGTVASPSRFVIVS